jgi:uncharacterized protein YjbI with pentapeptide repeats
MASWRIGGGGAFRPDGTGEWRLALFALLGGALLALILALLLLVPRWLYPPLSSSELQGIARDRQVELRNDRLKLQNDARATLLQGLAGLAVLLGAAVAYRQFKTGREQLRVGQEGQITERFTRAIDQLGRSEIDVRRGGIYALGRLANDSPPGDRATITDILTAFVREHAPWPPRLPGQYVAHAPIQQVPELRVRAADVQAAMTVLTERQPAADEPRRLELRAVDLRKVSLAYANLQGAHLDGANLQQALLEHADLQGAKLIGANLQGAQLIRANLHGSHLYDADLQWATLMRANLQLAFLNGASLQGAVLDDADLQHATLDLAKLQGARFAGAVGAKLQAARLLGAHLQEAILVGANLQRAQLYSANLQGAQLDGADLQGARIDHQTVWPDGRDAATTTFDWRAAGVQL